jgi:secernin
MIRSCDTMVALGAATKQGQTLFAKNSDRPANECQPLVQHPRRSHSEDALTRCQYVTLPEATTTYRHIGSRPDWCWGYEHGFNEHQVVIGNEGLGSKLKYAEPKLVGMELLRLGLERSRTASEAVEVITDLITRWGQGIFEGGPAAGSYDNGYLIADPREAYVIETAGHHWAVQRVEQTVGISNVYALHTDWERLSPDAETYAREQGWWSPEQGWLDFAAAYSREGWGMQGTGCGARRRSRSCSVLAQEAGRIDASTMMSLLSDHSDGLRPEEPFRTDTPVEGGICVHYSLQEGEEKGGNTAASLVADLCADGSRLPVYWCSFYSPCLGVFLPVFMEGTLPPALSVGEATPAPESPWWQFHRLSRFVRAEPERRLAPVRQEWAEFQQELLASAYPLAREGRRLLDNGQTDAASELLTDYMKTNVAEMRSRLAGILREDMQT